MTRLLVGAAALLCLTSSPFASTQIPGAAQAGAVALVGATVHTVSGDAITNGTVLFADGLITAVGANVVIPADALQIDVTGRHVYPGMIDGASILGLSEISAVRAGND